MLKYTCALAVVLASIVMAVQNLQEAPIIRTKTAFPADFLDADVVARRTEQIDAEVQACRRFNDFMRSTVNRLAKREMCLCRACQQVHDYAVKSYPVYFRRLGVTTLGEMKEKISDRLIEHLNWLAETSPESLRRVQECEREMHFQSFRAWCSQPWENSDLCPHACESP